MRWTSLKWVLVSMLAAVSVAGGYELTWYTMDGGGGRSEGGAYALEGTIGQPDTGVSSADPYVLSAGFWPGQFGCIVNLTDLAVFAEQWMLASPGAPYWPADFDKSGNVDITDFATLSAWWFDHCPADWPLK